MIEGSPSAKVTIKTAAVPNHRTVKATYPRPAGSPPTSTPAPDASIELTPSQTQSLPFPIGCMVCTHSESPFHRGEVTKVHWKVINGEASHLYEVSTGSSTVLLEKSKLRFASRCPILYSQSCTFRISGGKHDMRSGKILTCQKTEVGDKTHISYTLMINSNESSGETDVIENATPNQIKYDSFANKGLFSTLEWFSKRRGDELQRPVPDESQNDNELPKPTSANSRRPIYASSTNTPVSEHTELDVLCGRGGLTNNHPGNLWFRDEALKLCGEYSHSSTTKEQKSVIAFQLINSVKAKGGRFLMKGKDGLWHFLDSKAEKNKASQGKGRSIMQSSAIA